MKLERKVYTTRNEKVLDFVLGFVGWFVVNGLLYGCSILILQAIDLSAPDSISRIAAGPAAAADQYRRADLLRVYPPLDRAWYSGRLCAGAGGRAAARAGILCDLLQSGFV